MNSMVKPMLGKADFKGRCLKCKGRSVLESTGSSLAVGKYLQRASTPPPPRALTTTCGAYLQPENPAPPPENSLSTRPAKEGMLVSPLTKKSPTRRIISSYMMYYYLIGTLGMGPSIDYVHNFTCCPDSLPFFCM